MSRWQPDSRRRMQDAALELFDSQGYAETTAAAVAERAGVTERTFYRHFEDKKEVLFQGGEGRAALVEAVAASTEDTAVEVAADGIRAVARILQADQARVRVRAAVIAITPELQERERTKMADWTTATSDALTGVGVEPDAARVAAGIATAIFGLAYEQWTSRPGPGDLIMVINANLDLVRSVVTSIPRG